MYKPSKNRLVIIFSIFISFTLLPNNVIHSAENTLSGDDTLGTGLVSYWPLDEEGGIRKAVYSSNNLEDNNLVGYATGVQGNAVDCDAGNMQWLSISDDEQVGLDITSDLSLSLWVNPKTVSEKALVAKWHHVNKTSYFLGMTTVGPNWINSENTSGYTYSDYQGNYIFNPNSWHHLVSVYDSSEGSIEFFVNGISAGYSSDMKNSISESGAPFTICSRDSSLYFDGLIDEVGIWDRVLTEDEIARLYNNGEGIPYGDGEEEPEDGASSILFLPGITGSRLYVDGWFGIEDRVWEPEGLSDLGRISFTKEGESERDDVYTRDIVDVIDPIIPWHDETEGYSGFKSYLDSLTQDGKINEWKALPYDWRLATDKLFLYGEELGDGDISYLTGEQSEPYIITQIEEMAESSETGKVSIIAHSNGGLVAKNLIKYLKDTDHPLLAKIDTVALVGVPQLGTPKTIGELLHGITDTKAVQIASRDAMENIPGVYGLLPSQTLLGLLEDPIADVYLRDKGSSPFRGFYDKEITTYDELRGFLLGENAKRNEPSSADVWTPNVLNENILEDAEEMHDGADTFYFPSELTVVEVVGTGITTPGGVRYVSFLDKHGFFPGIATFESIHEWMFTQDGDGTVVTASADAGKDVDKTVYVPFNETNKDNNENYRHGTMLSSSVVQDILENIVIEGDLEYAGEYEERPEYTNTKRAELRIYSPVDVHLHRDGKHTGIVEGGEENEFGREYEEEIPTSYYERWGEVTYLGSEFYGGEEIEIKLVGLESGVFTLEIDIFDGEEKIGTYVFKDIPVVEGSEGTIALTGDDTPELHYDIDGDGDPDEVLEPGESVVSEIYLSLFEDLADSLPKQLKKWFMNKLAVIEELMDKSGKGTATAIENQFKEIFRKLQ